MSEDSSVDDAAIRRVLAGDRNAFGAIIGKYGARVIAFCRSRMKSEEEARDAAQEVFLRAYTSLDKFRLGERFPPWLFTIAANHVRTRFRLISADRRAAQAVRMQVEIAASSDPVDEADGAFRAESLRKAIATLGGDLRRAVELYYFAGLSVDETAKVLGVGGEAVKSRLFRARKALRKYLEKAEEGHPSIEMESRESRAR
jgi:RNA polymerase sigma-70 factor (ECF subfamily)